MIRHRVADTWWLLVRGLLVRGRGRRERAASETMFPFGLERVCRFPFSMPPKVLSSFSWLYGIVLANRASLSVLHIHKLQASNML